MTPKPSPRPRVVHDAATESTGLTPCCAQDPRELGRTDAFSLEHGEVTCSGVPAPEATA